MVFVGKSKQMIIILRHHGRRHRGIPDVRMSVYCLIDYHFQFAIAFCVNQL